MLGAIRTPRVGPLAAAAKIGISGVPDGKSATTGLRKQQVQRIKALR
jgi:hypothetical protein